MTIIAIVHEHPCVPSPVVHSSIFILPNNSPGRKDALLPHMPGLEFMSFFVTSGKSYNSSVLYCPHLKSGVIMVPTSECQCKTVSELKYTECLHREDDYYGSHFRGEGAEAESKGGSDPKSPRE